MVKWIVASALAGWAGIVALGCWLANARIAICPPRWDDGGPACIIRTTAARDGVLLTGLTVGLTGLIVVALVYTRILPRFSGWRAPFQRPQNGRLS